MHTQRMRSPLLSALAQWVGVMALVFPAPTPTCAATLEKLSNDRLISESTEILRGTVLYCTNEYRPPVIYTICEVNVTERLKGPAAARVQVAIPGGTAAGFRQTIEGAPTLQRGGEYLLFLWQGKSGLKQIMGLSQGLMNVVKDAQGNLIVVRAKSEERMVDSLGKPVEDSTLTMAYQDIAKMVRATPARVTAKAVGK
jgi:hypothetical protein